MYLGLLFLIIAIFYAGVGFGGGSSYLALLVLWKVPFEAVPIIALLCNIVVVSGNIFHYVRAGYLKWRLLLPLVIPSIPMSYMGGRLPIGKEAFVILLFVILLVTGLRLLIDYRKYDDNSDFYKSMPIWLGGLLGSVLGILAGVTGIGGGIFLAPILYYFRSGSPRQIACTASLFILINSISGLLGQLHKNALTDVVTEYWYLPLLAFIGGQLGNFMVIKVIRTRVIALLTALLVLFVAGQMGLRIMGW